MPAQSALQRVFEKHGVFDALAKDAADASAKA